MMKKLRWAMDGDFWEQDMSTPATLAGVARPVAGGDGFPLPLGLSRGVRLSRPRQIDFFQRFMAAPLVPSFSDGAGLSLQRLISLPFPSENWFTTLLGQFNVQKFASSLRRNGFRQGSDDSILRSVLMHLPDPKLYALNFCSEWLVTPQDTVVFTSEADGDADVTTRRNKAILHHKFPNHNLTLEASSPALFVDHLGNYWDVPFTLAVDLASLPSSSGTSCHFCMNHNAGYPQQFEGQPSGPVPTTLLPGLCAKSAVSVHKNYSIWRSEAPKARMVQPYDILLSNPHISASTTLGSVVAASLGDNPIRAHPQDESFNLHARGANYAVSADLFASASISAQLGNFQKLFLDLTRIHARVDIPLVSKFLNGASKVGLALYNSEPPTVEAVQAISPSATLSFQQQIAGPFSFRVDVDVKKDDYLNVNMNNPIFAVEYTLQVLGSAKAVAWYSPKQREFMIELRFFET